MTSILAGITIVFTLAWCAAKLLRRASASARHAVWTCAFAAALLLAPLRWRLPQHAIARSSPAIAVSAVSVPGAPAPLRPIIHVSTIFAGLWAFGTGVLLLRLLRHAIGIRSIVRSARGARPVLTSARIRGPVVAGLLPSAVLLPERATGWTVSRRRAVLAHEAAHIRRGDPVVLLTAQLVTALYWFHPFCWFAAARLRAESERACDDAALRIGLLPSSYAGHLLDLACGFDLPLAIPMATTSHLESRVKMILDPLTNHSAAGRTTWLAAIVLTAAVLAPLTTLTLTGQQTAGTATISGRVIDPTGALVPGVRLSAANTDLGNREVTASGSDGSYVFRNIPAGHYTIEAEGDGFQPFEVKDLALVNGGQLQVDAKLIVGRTVDRVTVAVPGAVKRQPASSGPPQRIRIGGNVQAANLIQQTQPVYPPDLQAQGIEGTVLLSAVISKEGVPQSLSVQNTVANPAFSTAAMDAVNQWRYRPALLNGEPIEVLTTIQIDFKLKSQPAVIDDRLIPQNIRPRK